jgi:NhaA family Na+:H+ antiporter
MAKGPFEDPTVGSGLPSAPVDQFTRPVQQFLRIEALSGIVLALCTAVAIVVANSSHQAAWQAFWDQEFSIGFGSQTLAYPLWYWVNDALMVIFFFVVGLEIKRELVEGHLSDRRTLMLPVAAAVGGAVVPALIFLALQRGTPGADGWAVPMATDIAFVVGCLALLGKRVPTGLKIFVLSLAIVDDLIAVLVIALFYAKKFEGLWLVGALGFTVVVLLLQKLGVRRLGVYWILGAALWFCMLQSGVHPTVAGVVLGVLTPVKPWVRRTSVREVMESTIAALDRVAGTKERPHLELERLAFAAREARSPLERLEERLHPWVSFAVMPIFALANAAVPVTSAGFEDPLALAVAGALVVGKPVGIVAASLVVVKVGLATLPRGVNFAALVGAGVLSGTGFTMSLFIASLSFEGELLDAARTGILLGSGVAIAIGMTTLAVVLKKPAT